MSNNNKILDERRRVGKQVVLVGVILNSLLSIGKIVVGFLGQSVALMADGFHSASDLISDAAVFLGIHISTSEADENHPYGHGKFESITVLFVGGLLITTAIGLIYNATERFHTVSPIIPKSMTIWAAAISIIVKELLYQYSHRMGTKIKSPSLIANAWHNRSDAFSSAAALVGILMARLGFPILDPLTAIGVAFIIGGTGAKIGLDALKKLTDAAVSPETLEKIEKAIALTPEVQSFHMVKARYLGPEILTDVHIQVSPFISVSEGHQIAEMTRNNIRSKVPEVMDVLVHIDTAEDVNGFPIFQSRSELENLIKRQLEKMPTFLTFHSVTPHYTPTGIVLDLLLSTKNEVSGEELKKEGIKVKTYLLENMFFLDLNVNLRITGV